jgi:hypothetical protein
LPRIEDHVRAGENRKAEKDHRQAHDGGWCGEQALGLFIVDVGHMGVIDAPWAEVERAGGAAVSGR